MARIWDKLTLFNVLKITNNNNNNRGNNNNNIIAGSKTVNIRNQYLVRACKLGFPFLVLSNVALAGYVMAKAKQRDEVKAKHRDRANAKKKDGSNAKLVDEANASG